jgi:hypothetical protein
MSDVKREDLVGAAQLLASPDPGLDQDVLHQLGRAEHAQVAAGRIGEVPIGVRHPAGDEG